MCEEEPPVQALQFLQENVSSVVDHKNDLEAATFRSLLTYLFSPSLSIHLPPRLIETIEEESPEHSSDSRNASVPTSRSRRFSSDSGGGTWTSHFPGEDTGSEEDFVDEDLQIAAVDVVESAPRDRSTAGILRGIVDPLEIGRGRMGGVAKAVTLTSERYHQRMAVYEALLEFVSEGQKEPGGSLLDMVNREEYAEFF